MTREAMIQLRGALTNPDFESGLHWKEVMRLEEIGASKDEIAKAQKLMDEALPRGLAYCKQMGWER